jgi:hypothetical protein
MTEGYIPSMSKGETSGMTLSAVHALVLQVLPLEAWEE